MRLLVSRVLPCLFAGLVALSARAAEGPPSILTQPVGQTVLQGMPVTFSVVADGTAPLSYQWRRNGTEILGATSDTYSIPAAASGDNNVQFSVVVSNALNTATSANALLRVDPGVLVTTTSNLINISTHQWRYFTNGGDLGTAWRETNYVESGWQLGAALFGVEVAGVYAEPIRTPFTAYTQSITTYYFRAQFTYTPGSTLSNLVGQVVLSLTANIDDGAVFYLNGAEIHRVRIPAGQTAATFATGDAEGATEAMSFAPTNLVVGNNVLAVEVHQQTAASSDIVFGMNLTAAVTNRVSDLVPPVISTTTPQPNITVVSLNQVEVFFSEPVQGVDPTDLLINGQPTSSVFQESPAQFRFAFNQPMTGQVVMAFVPAHGITDLALNLNPFAGATWTNILDPNAAGEDVRISEFMADNQTGIRDADGDRSDWIEIFNASSIVVDLSGWFLSDDALVPAKWRFPQGSSIQPNAYLLVWASEKNRINPAAPLHTNFRLDPDGEHLGLYSPNTNLVSGFAPLYPPQRPDVSFGRDRQDPNSVGYYSVPTPGANNPVGGSSSDFAPDIVFSKQSGTFLNPFNANLTLATPAGDAVIRYVIITNLPYANQNNVVTNVPTANSPAYSVPFPIFHTTQIRARSFQPGKLPGTPVTMTYIQLSESVRTWSSDLPVCIIHTLGATNTGASQGISTSGDQAAVFMTFENDCGRSSLTNFPQVASRIGVNTRGASTGGQPKSNFAVELWDELNQDTDLEVLGMPPESDWVLYGINGFDPGLMHNAIFHWFGRQLDNQFAARTRYVEVFRKIGPGPVTTNDYFGLYLLEEKPKRNNERVDIAALQPEDTNAPAITGGYILRIDRTGTGNGEPNERSFQPPTINGLRSTPAPIIFDYPNVTPATTDGRVLSQIGYIQNYILNFITNLTSPGFTNTVTGYHQYIDADQWVDNLIGNMVCFNVDGYRLSGYFHKDREDRLMQGPYWDCDRCMGTGGGGGGATPQGDNRPFSPFYWRLPAFDVGTDNGTDFFGVSNVGVSWFSRLFRDPDFWQRYIDRYQMHRTNVYSTNAVLTMIDGFHNQIREAQTREVRRWAPSGFTYPRSGSHSVNGYAFNFGPALGGGLGSAGAFSNEVNFQKKWFVDRFLFFDTNFLAMPTLSRGTEFVASGATATVTPAAKAGTVLLYTLDGSDPRLPGGAVSPAALTSVGPLTLTVTENIRVFARSYNTSHSNLVNAANEVGKPLTNSFWSGPVAATYYTAVPPLRITELMYHPAPPSSPADTNDQDNFEYIEVRNISGSDLNVNGFRLRGGVDFAFPNVTLPAGQSAVLVKNLASFQARYGLGPMVLGSYSNNLANDGDHLVLEGPLREPILDFSYKDNWYPSTDGAGFSLQITSDALPAASWGLQSSWRASSALGGTPGVTDLVPAVIPAVYINEILTHTVLPDVDAIELHNPGGTPVNVGGWFLTDDFGNPTKYRLPNPTMIGANSYLVLYANTSFGAAFNLSSKGDEVYLFSGDSATTNLTGYVHGFDFGPQFRNVTFGRHLISSGMDHFPAQAASSLGSANTGPQVGPVVISEIMYRHTDLPTIEGPRDNDKYEYIELANIGTGAAPLYDTNGSTWRLRDAVRFTFPPNTLLLPGERVVVVPFDPAADPMAAAQFRATNQLSFLARLFGPYEGQLDNSGDAVELVRPEAPQPASEPDAGAVYYVLADKVAYADRAPWPTNADATGRSLHRIVLGNYGNDATNWMAAAASPGAGPIQAGGPVFTLQPESRSQLGTLSTTFSVMATGAPPILYQWYFGETEIPGATSSNYTIGYLDVSYNGIYRCRAMNGEGYALSSNATLTVVVPAFITLNPTNVTLRVPPDPQALANRSATFRVSVVSSNPPLSFHWQLRGTNLPVGSPNYIGVTTSNLIVTNILAEHAGPYRCAITDGAGTVFSLEAVLSTLVGPVFIVQPQSQTILQGDPVTLSLQLSNVCTGPFNYIWRHQSLIIASNHMVSAYFSSITLTNVALQASNLNRYRCDVQSPATTGQGTASGNALITVFADFDRDRVPDFWEVQYGLSTNNAADALLDSDGDLMLNIDEYNGGTDPTDPASVLKVTEFLLGPGESTFSFLAISNRTYSVQAGGMVPGGPWFSVTNVGAAPSNRTVLITNAPVLPPPQFIRIVTPQQP